MKFDDDGRLVEPTDREVYRGIRWGVVAVVAVIILVPVAVYGIRWVTADARGAGAAREQIKANGAFRIAAYDEFFNLCTAVQAQEDRIGIFRDDQSPEGQTNLRAIEAKRAELIREYNAKASRTYTEGQFRSSRLPYELNPNQENTQCNI